MTDATLDIGAVDVDEFAEFWAAYPRHKDRFRAVASYRRARRIASHDDLLDGARRYAAETAGRDVSQIRIATSWLSSEAWGPARQHVTPAARQIVHAPHSGRRHGVRRVVKETPKQKWCRRHGVSVEEFDARRGDREWIDLLVRRGVLDNYEGIRDERA
ncbi:hypothetical protein [Rathayibacter soli]|uniref:hypothetical protein n=1 Tax=Rathayibacter soli TaxID=3144168 RepID=UPI0027E530BF|nr:hypothetical protein [Glaciibacter superstes]